jgi:uncharacterized protein (DUF433 family)
LPDDARAGLSFVNLVEAHVLEAIRRHHVVIDPHISYGRPVLVGTGIPTAVVAERYKAGEPIDELAEDYGRSRKEIEEAIRCELWLDAA